MPLDLRETLKELEILEAVKESRKKSKGIEYYTPNPVQLRVHQSKADIILFCAGNRSGKSTAGAAELAMHLTRKYPSWFPKERRFYKPIKAVIVATENQIIEKVIEPKLKMYIPHEMVETWKKITGGYLNRIICKDGSTVDLLTNEQDDMAFESQDWDFYWGDEPQKERKFQAIMRGLVDRHGRGIITFTPLIEPWMKEKLVDKADGKYIEVITAQMRDNLFDVKGNSILKEADIARFEASLPDDVKETRVYGKFFHLRGTVYSEFSEIHQIDFEYNFPDAVIAVLDPHDRQPHHVVWAIVDKTGDIYVDSEMNMQGTVDELASAIKFHEKQRGYKMKKRIIDPNFGRKPLIITGRNMIEELYQSGCGGWVEADDAKEEGHLKVKDYLHYDRTKPISHTNRPKLFFNKSRCPITIRSMKNYQYEEWVGKIASERDPKEKPKQRETHGADCVRYLCMTNPYGDTRKYDYELAEAPY